jgi:hypothetical protein
MKNQTQYIDEKWSGMRDLNPRPPRPERGALPNCANPRRRMIKMVGETGFEPATSRSQTARATKLRHSPDKLVIPEGITEADYIEYAFELPLFGYYDIS